MCCVRGPCRVTWVTAGQPSAPIPLIPVLPLAQDCTICMERLSAPSGYKGPQPAVKPDLVGKLVKCSHVFHLHCLVAMYNNGNKVRACGPGDPGSATSAELHELSVGQSSSLAALKDS